VVVIFDVVIVSIVYSSNNTAMRINIAMMDRMNWVVHRVLAPHHFHVYIPVNVLILDVCAMEYLIVSMAQMNSIAPLIVRKMNTHVWMENVWRESFYAMEFNTVRKEKMKHIRIVQVSTWINNRSTAFYF